MLFTAEVVILYEPTSTLGVKGTAKVIGIVRRLCDQGVAAVVPSHPMNHVVAAWGRVVAMALGRAVLDRRAAEAAIDGAHAVPWAAQDGSGRAADAAAGARGTTSRAIAAALGRDGGAGP